VLNFYFYFEIQGIMWPQMLHMQVGDLQYKCPENNECLQLWKHSRNFLSMFWKFTWDGTGADNLILIILTYTS